MINRLLYGLVTWLLVSGWLLTWVWWSRARDLRRLLDQYREDYTRRGKIIMVLWDIVYRVGGEPAVEEARRRLGPPEEVAQPRNLNVN